VLSRLFAVLCVALVWTLCLSAPVAAEEKEDKAVDASIVKVDGDKVTVKVEDKEQSVDLGKDKVKIMKGKKEAKASDLKEGAKVKVNINKDKKVSIIRLPE